MLIDSFLIKSLEKQEIDENNLVMINTVHYYTPYQKTIYHSRQKSSKLLFQVKLEFCSYNYQHNYFTLKF
jgi:hypothetical protein